jgi:hypothetical protein
MSERTLRGQTRCRPGQGQAAESFEIRDGRKQGWFWAYDAIFDLDISEHAKLVYLNLCRRANKNGNAFSSHARIARDCSISARTVRRALGELVQVGAIRITSRKQKGLLNLYHLTDLSEWEGGSATQTYPLATQTYPLATQADIGLPYGNAQKDSLCARENEHPYTQSEEQGGATAPKLTSLDRTTPAEPSSAILPTAERKQVKDFYSQIGQPRISRQKLEAGVKVLTDLKDQGFSSEEISWGLTWTLNHKDQFGREIHSLGLLPCVIGQALQERDEAKRATAKKQQHADKEQQHRAEQTRQQHLEKLYHSLAPAEQAFWKEQAVQTLLQSGIARRFLSEVLVKAEACRLLGERSALQGTQSINLAAGLTIGTLDNRPAAGGGHSVCG